MTITYESAVTLVEQLSPVDQARLVALLAERLQQTLQPEPSPRDEPEPAFWHLIVDDNSWATHEASQVASPQLAADARAETQTMLTRWFGAPLREEDALDLAMSAPIAEWNVDE